MLISRLDITNLILKYLILSYWKKGFILKNTIILLITIWVENVLKLFSDLTYEFLSEDTTLTFQIECGNHILERQKTDNSSW